MLSPISSFDGIIWPAIPSTKAAALLSIQAQLMLSERADPAAIRTLQFRQIGALVKHIFAHIPAQAKRLSQAGILPGIDIDPEKWAALRPLTRMDVQNLGSKLHAATLPKGHGRVSTAHTSGSSGRPVEFIKSELDYLFWQAFQLRGHLWHQRDFAGSFAVILRNDRRTTLDETAHVETLDNWGPPVGLIYPTGPVHLIDYRATIEAHVTSLCELAPDYLATLPSILQGILEHVSALGITLPPMKEVILAGEAVSKELRRLTADILGAKLTETYSAAEIGGIALECPQSQLLHVQSERVLLEVIREDGSPCEPGETGRVILTQLQNFAMPLLRYEIGDLATVATAPCVCGRTLPTLSDIPGRARDLMVLPSGHRRPPYYGHKAIALIHAIVQHQVVQIAADRVEIRLVLRQALTPLEESQIISAAEQAIGNGVKVLLREVKAIERGQGGKYAEFYSLVDKP
jgi:phenylacetate-CoA ligase